MTDFHLDGFHLKLLFLKDDAGITSNENSHSTVSLLGILVRFLGFSNHPVDIVRVDHPDILDTASLH
jgi:hypothetical protein